MNAPDWLVARPIAHRGLHARARGVIENSMPAARAAIEAGYAIECDVQLTGDGEAVVFHDFDLQRLTASTGEVRTASAAHLAGLRLSGSDDTIPSLRTFLDLLTGRTPLILEVKSRFDGDMRLVRRVGEVLKTYDGPVAVKSFDPDIVAEAAICCAGRPRGIIAQAQYDYAEWSAMPQERTHALANLLHLPVSKPDFVSWRVRDLPTAAPFLCRHLARMPLMTWTVRTPADRERARAHADQMVFEGFRP